MTAWDEFDAYLFDIDGTLLNCRDAVHYFAFCEVLTSVVGRPMNLEGVTTHGNTDVGILRDALHRAGIAEQCWRPRLPEMKEEMGRFVAARMREFQIEPTVRILDVLDHLKRKGAVLGIATGNLEQIGRAKLARAGMLERFDFGGYSDRHESRKEVFGSALATARSMIGTGVSVCVAGDTPADVRAARACGLPVIAVATGVFSYQTLLAEEPDWCLRSFAEVLG